MVVENIKRASVLMPAVLVTGGALCLLWVASVDWQSDEVLVDQHQDVWRNSVGMEFVAIPSGRFMMGRDEQRYPKGQADELPAREVEISAFSMSRFEVTQAQWQDIMGENPSRFRDPRRPVENVSWYEVQSFIARLNDQFEGGYRLPSEAEWEYAARAGAEEQYHFGDDAEKLSQYAWFGEPQGHTYPVGEKAPNAWGLHDMHGNVWEWVMDCWTSNHQGAPVDGSVHPGGECGQRVLRGGAWNNDAERLRVSARGAYAAHFADFTNGFRLVRE